MLITQKQFQERFDNKNLKICFIGMSNIGKSHAGRLLRDDYDFNLYEVDEAIQKSMNIEDMEKASTWMGYPFEQKYKENETYYLELETEKTTNAPLPQDQNFVLDTTGSVINLDPSILKKLREEYLIISFDVGLSMCQEMIEAFFTSPKTVVWGNNFSKRENERDIDALRRCYPNLLKDRIDRYRDLADVVIPGELSRLKGLKSERMFEMIKLSLPKE